MKRVALNIRRMMVAFTVALTTLSISLAAAPSAQAQTSSKPAAATAKKKPVKKKKAVVKKKSNAARQADAMRRLKDYNYVKSMSPYSGSAYKWGSPW